MNLDAFSSGQVQSKLWLCRELERLPEPRAQRISILAGWYGLLAFLLLSRERMNIEKITLFEQDAEAKMISDKLNKVWIGCGGRFESLIQDIQVMDHALHPADLIINTSTEHFYDDRWWGRVPSGRRVVLQGTDQKDSSHVAGFANLTEFKNRFELREMEFVGSMDFNFTDKSYQRFMLIGRK